MANGSQNGNGTNGGPVETFAMETRAEKLSLMSRTKAARNGESDRLEVGRGGGSDTVLGTESLRVGGNLTERGHDKAMQAELLETKVDGKMTLRAFSDTTMMAGAMTDVQTGAMLVLAGMSDDLCVGGGIRMSMMDLWVCGLMGMEENPMSAHADAVFLEGYRTHFEREYGAGIHFIGSATFTGALHTTMATGFRALANVAMGVRNMTPGGGASDGGGGPTAPAAAAPPPPEPRPANSNSALLTTADDVADVEDVAQIDEAVTAARYVEVQAIDNMEDSASVLEDLRQLDATGDLNMPGLDDLDDTRRIDDLDVELYAVVQLPGFEDGTFRFEKTDFDLGIVRSGEFELPDPTGYDDLPLNMMDDYDSFNVVRLPEDFDYNQALDNFRQTLEDDYRRQTMPGLAVMQQASDEAAQLPWLELSVMDPEWLADAGITAEDLEDFKRNPSRAYQAIVEMEAAARAAGDADKAAQLRQSLEYIDTRTFMIFEEASKTASAMRPTGFLPIPGNVNVDSVIADLEAGLADLQRQGLEAAEAGDTDKVLEIGQKNSYYITAITALKNGYDPTPYLEELTKTAMIAADGDPLSVSAINAGYDEVFALLGDTKHLYDPALPPGFHFDPGDLATGMRTTGDFRDLRGIPPDFSYAEYRNYLINLLDQADEGTDVEEIRTALENIEEAALAQLDSIPAKYIEETGMWQDVANAKASGDPLEAYRVLEQMEQFYRSSGDAGAAAKADGIRSMINSIDALTIDEYTKVYDLVEEVATQIRATTPVPILPDPINLGDNAEDADEFANVRDNAESIYDFVSPRNLDSDDAATFDDVQAGLDLNPNQVNIENAAGEEPIYATIGDPYDDIVVYSRAGDIEPEPIYDEIAIYDNVTQYQNVLAPEGEESGYALLGHREDGTIYGDFGPVNDRDRLLLGQNNPSFPPDRDKYVPNDELLAQAKGKYKKAGDWSEVATDHVRFFDFEEDPLAIADEYVTTPVTPTPPADPPPVEDTYYKWNGDGFVPLEDGDVPPAPGTQLSPDDPVYYTWNSETGQFTPVGDDIPAPPPPPTDDPDAQWIFDPATGQFKLADDPVIPPPATPEPIGVRLETDGQVFTGYFPEGADDFTTLAGEDIYEVTRTRADTAAEEGLYNRLVFGFQEQPVDSIYSTLDELKMSTEFEDAVNTNIYVNWENGRAILVESLDSATDIVTPPPTQPTGLDRPGKISVWVDESGELITVVDFADDVVAPFPPVTADMSEALYESLSPVMLSQFEQSTSPTIKHVDGTPSVIESAWESTDPLVTVLNREPHVIAAEAFESIDLGEQLPRLNTAVNSLTDVSQSGGAAFGLADLENLQDLSMFEDLYWTVGADPVLNPQFHEMSERGDDIVSVVLNRGALGGTGARPRW